MLPSTQQCAVCAKHLPPDAYLPRGIVCTACLSLPVDTAVRQARAALSAEHTLRLTSRAGRRTARRAALREQIDAHGKRCTSCHACKPADAFSVCEPRLDGLQPECRACAKLRATLFLQPGGRDLWHKVRDDMRASAAKKIDTGGN